MRERDGENTYRGGGIGFAARRRGRLYGVTAWAVKEVLITVAKDFA